MRKRGILLYWLLLFIPTLIAGGVMFHLLRHERDRVARAVVTAAEEQARLAANQVELAVEDLKSDLTQRLTEIPDDALAATLTSWEEENPLVRNVFIWHETTGLALPSPERAMTREEQSFVQRFDALFSGRVPWHEPAGDQAGTRLPHAVTGETGYGPQQKIRRWTRSGEGGKVARRAEAPKPEHGWRPWFWENQLHLLGWVRQSPAGPRYGIEVEMVSLLAVLLDALPANMPAGQTIALLDGSGTVIHQRGGGIIETPTPRRATVSLNTALPHGQVVVYETDPRVGAASARLFLPLSLLLVSIFVVAVVAGGTLLLRQARRTMLDAARKTSFVSNVSHELKTPLTSIRMYAELLGEGRVHDKAKAKHYLDVIVKESRRLTRLVNNVLDFGRLEQNRKRYRIEPLDLAELVREIMEREEARLHEAGLSVTTDIPDVPQRVAADRDALEQTVLNLIDNAIKYAARGGRLAIGVEQRDGRARVTVEDSGPGVPPAHRERIFEQFHRVDDSLTADVPGSGLGLSIARRLMQGMGGDLTFEPAASGGARFTMVLP